MAADLLSQAEHDTRARAILVTDSQALADAVESEIERQLKLLPREAIARPSIENNGRIIIANDTDAMFELMNLVAPEHLEIAMTMLMITWKKWKMLVPSFLVTLPANQLVTTMQVPTTFFRRQRLAAFHQL